MIAFQPEGSFCSERMPARSAARSTSTNGAVLTFVPLAAWAPCAATPPAPLEAARLSSVALSAEAFRSKKGMKESPLSEIVSSIEELPPLRLSSDRLWSSEPESEARPAEGKMRTVLFESNPWLDRTATGGMLSRICCAERMSKPAIWGISMLRRVASRTVIELAESTPTLAESHPPGCGTIACKPSTKACPAALASSPSAQASSARVTSMVHGSNERMSSSRASTHVPSSTAEPPTGKMGTTGSASSTRCETTAEAGTVMCSVSAARMSYSSTASRRRSRCVSDTRCSTSGVSSSRGTTTRFQPRASDCAEAMPMMRSYPGDEVSPTGEERLATHASLCRKISIV